MVGLGGFALSGVAASVDISRRSLQIPNSSISSIGRRKLALSFSPIYTNSTNRQITTSALTLRLVSLTNHTITSININIYNGSTMSGGSRQLACPRGGRAGAAGCEAAEAVRKAEWPWSPEQSFTAGYKPDGNVCRAELDEVEVTEVRSAAVAGTTLVLRNAVERDECDIYMMSKHFSQNA